MPAPTFLASFGLIGLRLIEAHGVRSEEFLANLGIRVLGDTHRRLPSNALDQAFAEAARRIQDPTFALQAGAHWHPSDLGVLGHAWLTSESLHAALARMSRYAKLIGQRMSARCETSRSDLRFVYDSGRGSTPIADLMADFDLSLVLSMCRMNAGPSLRPLRVDLRRASPPSALPWERAFEAPVRFGARENSLLFARADAERTLPTAHAELAETLDQILVQQLASLGEGDLQSRCRAWILQHLSDGDPSDEDLAAHLAMSSRTLHRRLQAEGLSFSRLLDDTRRDLAQRYLRESGRTVTDVTFLLGFSEQSAFSRAFKRWTGVAPSEFRARSQSASAVSPDDPALDTEALH
ncbi:hypothetical protein IP84_08470 [beta proteobacterium AAP99]|nr:hypothetical protein IP84_08470 [beta proteobacterium AAP99]